MPGRRPALVARRSIRRLTRSREGWPAPDLMIVCEAYRTTVSVKEACGERRRSSERLVDHALEGFERHIVIIAPETRSSAESWDAVVVRLCLSVGQSPRMPAAKRALRSSRSARSQLRRDVGFPPIFAVGSDAAILSRTWRADQIDISSACDSTVVRSRQNDAPLLAMTRGTALTIQGVVVEWDDVRSRPRAARAGT